MSMLIGVKREADIRKSAIPITDINGFTTKAIIRQDMLAVANKHLSVFDCPNQADRLPANIDAKEENVTTIYKYPIYFIGIPERKY